MNERCPSCALKFEREEGYFLGAMYISYALGVAVIVLFGFLLWEFMHWPLKRATFWAIVLFVPLAPALSYFSRVLWIYLDQAFDPE